MAARSESRDGYRVRVLAVHDTEGGGTARQLRDAPWWEGSSHAIADNLPEEQGGGLLTPADGCVPYDRASWTLRSGNRWSENIELVGMASWSRAKWLTQELLLDRCARWLADRSKACDVPLVKITAAQYRAGASGVIGHWDHTVGYSDGTHWDPGPNFPWDVVMPKAVAYRDGARLTPAPEEEPDMRIISAPKRGVALVGPGLYAGLRTDEEVKTARDWLKLPVHAGNDRQFDVARAIALRMQGSSDVLAKLNDVAARVAGIGTADVDEAALAALLAPKLAGVTSAQIADALRQVLREGVGAEPTA